MGPLRRLTDRDVGYRRGMSTLAEHAAELTLLIEDAGDRLARVDEAEVRLRPGPGRWSRLEILGHLIDSASNNHQRFVRAALHGELTFPGYEQEGWARIQHHQDAEWDQLLRLWVLFNARLAQVVARLPEDAALVRCTIGDGDPVTLQWLVEDYIRHMRHHLNQLLPADGAADAAARVRSLLARSEDADRLRRENTQLRVEVKALRREADAIARLLDGVPPSPGRPRGTGTKRGPGRPRKAADAGKRFRTTAAEVDRMTAALADAAPSEWRTKAEIVQAAGLTLEASAAAWKRVTEGYEKDGTTHPAVLHSNGMRGLGGRYRKA